MTNRPTLTHWGLALGLLIVTAVVLRPVAPTVASADSPTPPAWHTAAELWAKVINGPDYGQTFKLGSERLQAAGDPTTLRVSLADLKDMDMAMLKLPNGVKCVEGEMYVVRLRVKSDQTSWAVLILPETDRGGETQADGTPKASNKWFATGEGWSNVDAEFVFLPTMNDGAISIYFGKAASGVIFELAVTEVRPIEQ